MPPDPRVKVGVAAYVEHRGAVLLIQRGAPAEVTEGYVVDGVGEWGLPGGWLELGEAPAEAAVREAREETGVEVQPLGQAGFTHNYRSTGESIVTLFISCRWLSGEPRVMEPDKCPVVEWVNFHTVGFRPLFAPLRMWWPFRQTFVA